MSLSKRYLTGFMGILLLSACSTQADWLQKKRHYPDWEFSTRTVNQYSFKWDMIGDETIFPQQVFSTQDEVWIQLKENATIPVIFKVDKDSRVEVLKYYHNPPYIVLKGQYTQLRLQEGDRQVWLKQRP
ncbi:TrbG/VirB9 family P-type conjugative transfer protein [Pelistega sp. NLN82]|uniref:TrbG/VirB9 family P-type conjugative transfer protein n=1 Tax=Pelistega ratti TaxID=2652177 RepID=A0A6L9Y5J1_9BURK|nr:TrbG/VirB9 family P-type conjugative transfer protein [Pelistega ratti]NEN75730.1 TrbG/VirB9 family P-type conjugative transfer protein [Pelistega ratti]